MGQRRLAAGAIGAALAVVIAAFLARAVPGAEGPEQPPADKPPMFVAVLPFWGSDHYDHGRDRATFMFEKKIDRQPGVTIVDPMSVKNYLRRHRLDVSKMDDQTVARLMAEPLGAKMCVRGSIAVNDKAVTLKVRILEADEANSVQAPKFRLWFDETFELEHYRDMSPTIRQLALDIAGLEETPDRVFKRSIGPNIIPNGDFEKADAKGQLANWELIDGLSTFWVDEPGRGKILRTETDIPWGMWEDWRAKIRQGARPADAPIKPPFKPPGYGTVAGSRGVATFSEMVPIKPGQVYRLGFDIKGPPGAKVFVKGYRFRENQYREVWRCYKATRLKPEQQGKWNRFDRPFHPTEKVNPTHIRVMLFPYWPPGTYLIDNVVVDPVEEELVAAKRPFERQTPKKAAK